MIGLAISRKWQPQVSPAILFLKHSPKKRSFHFARRVNNEEGVFLVFLHLGLTKLQTARVLIVISRHAGEKKKRALSLGNLSGGCS